MQLFGEYCIEHENQVQHGSCLKLICKIMDKKNGPGRNYHNSYTNCWKPESLDSRIMDFTAKLIVVILDLIFPFDAGPHVN